MSSESNVSNQGVDKALDYFKPILIAGENIEAWAIQRRYYALSHRRVLIAATSGRFIVLKRGLFGGYELIDIRWQDIKDIKIRVGIFAADLTISFFSATDLAGATNTTSIKKFEGLGKGQAQEIYRLCQFHEQSWREKRRVREIEEMRAKAGGVQVATSVQPQSVDSGTAKNDAPARLQKAKQMLDANLISDSEYESIKAKIISEL